MVVASNLVNIRSSEVGGWELREAGPAGSRATALLLPGGMASAAFYDDVLAYATLADPDARLVAATPPGFAGRRAPTDVSVESFARLACELAARLDCRIVVGHSYGANIAIEMAATCGFDGQLILLSPTFSRRDEFKGLGVVDLIGRVPAIGRLVWAAVPLAVSRALRSSLPPARRDQLTAELRRNEPQVCRRMVRRYFEYLERSAPLVQRLCDTGVPTWVLFGDHDEVGLTTEERGDLQACPHVALDTLAGATHMLIAEEPKRIAELVLGVANGSTPS